jgi:hypothetical protein
MSLAGIVAVNWVALTKVVVRADPLKFTTDVDTKLVPLTVMVNNASPTILLLGVMLVVVGVGLLMAMFCVTCGAAFQLVLPAWLAAMVQVPAVTIVTVVPAMVHTPVVVEL